MTDMMSRLAATLMRVRPSGLRNRRGQLLPQIHLTLSNPLMGHHHAGSTSIMMKSPEACQRNLWSTPRKCKMEQLRQRNVRITTMCQTNRGRSGCPRVWLKRSAASTMLRRTMTMNTHSLQSDEDSLPRVSVSMCKAQWRPAMHHNLRPNTGVHHPL